MAEWVHQKLSMNTTDVIIMCWLIMIMRSLITVHRMFIFMLRAGEVLLGTDIPWHKGWTNSQEVLVPKRKARQRQVDIHLHTKGNVIFSCHVHSARKCPFFNRSKVKQSDSSAN